VTVEAVEAVVPWRVRDAALTFALGLGVVALLFAGALGLVALQGGSGDAPAQVPAALAAAATCVFYLTILAGMWLLVVRRYRVRWGDLGLTAPRSASLLPVLVLVVLFAIGSTLILVVATLVVDLLGSPTYVAPEDGLLSHGAGGAVFVVGVLTSLLLAPVAEELFFRGVLYQVWRQRAGKVAATAASALLFMLVHARSAVAPELFLLGVVLAMAFERTGSLYPSMCVHAAYNGAIIVLATHVI